MKITVVGVGRLGIALCLVLDEAGHDVLGVDVNAGYIECLNKREYKSKEPEIEERLVKSQTFKATTDMLQGLDHSDLIFIMVQTPNGGGDKFYDHSILSNVLSQINSYKPKSKHIIIGCTVMPKYISSTANLLLSDCNDTTVSYNPEFIAQGEIVSGLLYPDMVLVGTDVPSMVGPIIKDLYGSFVKSDPVYCIVPTLDAEISKIAINGYITTKLSFANMISDVCDTCGADKNKVLECVRSDTRVGNKYFSPGHSFGGPCFPRDTMALQLFVEQNNIYSGLLKSTSHYNNEHVKFQAKQWMQSLSSDEVIEVSDVCYKQGSKIPIIEESARLKIAHCLVKSGYKVRIKDEMHLIKEVQKAFGNIFEYEVIS